MKTGAPPASEPEGRRAADSGERAYIAIRKLLVEFHFRPEERINEMQVARSLGLSRTPVREALSRLASEGFVTLSPNRGFFVRSLSTEGMLDLYELRSILECAAFSLMCERATDLQLRQMQDFWHALEQGEASGGPDDILQHDENFHLLIGELSGNPEILAQLRAINARIRFIRRIQIEHIGTDRALISTHGDIVAAALRRDVAGGCSLLRNHIEMTVSATQRALKDALLRVYIADSQVAKDRPRQDLPRA